MSFPVAQYRDALLSWYRQHHRRLPWRETRDAYAILVSEVMLQQTRVAMALPYYERFLARFPTVQALAEAPEQDVLALWSGLGYYYRARNLQKTAQQVVALGSFPQTYEGLLALPGIGAYTAAAVASFAFQLPHAVLDGNVMRVVSRLANDSGDIQQVATKRRFQQIADDLLDTAAPDTYNQAVMELGATICTPQSPRCLLCPVQEFCEARQQGTQDELPVKGRRIEITEQMRTLLYIRRGTKTLFWQRPSEARLMPGFYELPDQNQLPKAEPVRSLGSIRHGQTRFQYTLHIVEAQLPRAPLGFVWLTDKQLAGLPVSTIARKALALVADTEFGARGV